METAAPGPALLSLLWVLTTVATSLWMAAWTVKGVRSTWRSVVQTRGRRTAK